MLPAELTGALNGVRVLALEQAVALPFATRHLADLGADVIRVQAYDRARAAERHNIELTRSKRQVGLNLAADGGPEAFLRLAAACDIVAHNFTPRVVRKFGIDYDAVHAVNPEVIYVSLTGFGTTGPWGERPLFGPGAEAVSGHNLLIGDPDAWPGRPGTGVYADDTCGLYTTMAILAALDHREQTGSGQHIDISLYETMVAHLGPVLAERSRGGQVGRVLNADAAFALHGVFDARGVDRHVAIAAHEEHLPAIEEALDLAAVTAESVAAAVALLDANEVEQRLQAAGVPASIVSDASDNLTDRHLWARQFFALREVEDGDGTAHYPHLTGVWGGAPGHLVQSPHYVGQDNQDVMVSVAGLTPEEVERLEKGGAIGTAQPEGSRRTAAEPARRIERGELSRVDEAPPRWADLAEVPRDVEWRPA
ncbi:MAG: CoA transferase [Dehalococcoidia bacterium]|nr:CoA transferase [Dehalococcoidia bacterium]